MARCVLAEGQETWEPGVATLSLAPVTALLALDGLLLAEGSGGIAYSYNNGRTWQQAELEDGVVSVADFAASPKFASDRTIVAATLTNGIVRTNDGGCTWTNASFGLGSLEVTALFWVSGMTVLAAMCAICWLAQAISCSQAPILAFCASHPRPPGQKWSTCRSRLPRARLLLTMNCCPLDLVVCYGSPWRMELGKRCLRDRRGRLRGLPYAQRMMRRLSG